MDNYNNDGYRDYSNRNYNQDYDRRNPPYDRDHDRDRPSYRTYRGGDRGADRGGRGWRGGSRGNYRGNGSRHMGFDRDRPSQRRDGSRERKNYDFDDDRFQPKIQIDNFEKIKKDFYIVSIFRNFINLLTAFCRNMRW